MSDTNGGEFDRAILGYDFDIESFQEERKCHYCIYSDPTVVNIILVPLNVCYAPNILSEVRPLHNYSGYVYCTDRKKGIKQICPEGTKASSEIGGCVNTTSKRKTI
jgi:hypothetical protein